MQEELETPVKVVTRDRTFRIIGLSEVHVRLIEAALRGGILHLGQNNAQLEAIMSLTGDPILRKFVVDSQLRQIEDFAETLAAVTTGVEEEEPEEEEEGEEQELGSGTGAGVQAGEESAVDAEIRQVRINGDGEERGIAVGQA